jgi:predicted kinase
MTPTGAGHNRSLQANQGHRRARISLLCGKTGSGKSSYARQLEAAGAMRFSTDEWMIRLFGHHMSRELFTERMATCESMVLDFAAQLAARGVDSVIDNGFWRRAGRDAARALLAHAPAEIELVYFDIPDAVLKERLHARNAALPEGTFEITTEMFDQFSSWFEAPEPDEHARVVHTEDTLKR